MAGFFGRHTNVYLYVPNLIGYARVVAAFFAFAVAFTSPWQCIAAYFFSFVCDELDGRFARMLNQTSTLGAVLDMDIGSKSWLVRTYYSNRLFMGYCCVSCEVLYLVAGLQQHCHRPCDV
ncbi:putative CDP-diacylglycerol--inositol 3-phosphatidyltransferase 2 [Tetrabaena socialis]|uniref:Putative CDP-diacylglycerol--inositol 3-phosphatidyltransferase 2 n=1 Tax=Tetrabaena socialis TaxID=47790 RepID=A0A2J7ZP89_9CHLO|nr:putative CDP-diacylglycerol--inositol 3-phosphatidyltransferase 2 [Tetrabaena socialis]|eukprot:PNH02087.1 putative CDP-diacylglycerol--inositol 3-phosphatidyltransferase 2 [Tetrabaena socialis]